MLSSRGRSTFCWLVGLGLLVPALAHGLPTAKAWSNPGKPLGADLITQQRAWDLEQPHVGCGPGVCVGDSFCDDCLCYASWTDISRAFCQCRLADPLCGLGECVGDSWCEGGNCPAPVCYSSTHPISQVLCQGAELGDDCQIKKDCGPGYCVGDSYCDDCACYAPSAPISQVACRCDLMDPTCGFGECVGGAWCEGGGCPFPVCYTPENPISLVMCSGAELDCNCELTCATPPPVMKAWWPLDETSGVGAADIAGGNNGVHQNGPVPTPGKVAGALSFDGVDDVVIAPVVSAHDYVNLTLDAWIRPDTLDSNGQVIVGFGNYLYEFWLEGDELRLVFQPNPLSYAPLSSGANVQTGVWTHVAVVADDNAGEFRFYVNGQLVTLYSYYTADYSYTGNEWRIGNAWGETFDGLIDEVEVFERALTQAEIQSIFDAGSAGKCKPR